MCTDSALLVAEMAATNHRHLPTRRDDHRTGTPYAEQTQTLSATAIRPLEDGENFLSVPLRRIVS
jgi:hypothetical protein